MTFLSGKKTYAIAAIAVGYLIGADLGAWPLNQEVLGIFAFLGLGTLRAGIGKPRPLAVEEPAIPSAPKPWQRHASLLSCTAAAALLMIGCSPLHLEQDGVYQGDQTLYLADNTITTAYDAMDEFVTWEYRNRSILAQWPEIKDAADHIRNHAEQWINSAITAREAYASVPNETNRKALTQAVAVIKAALRDATNYMQNYGS